MPSKSQPPVNESKQNSAQYTDRSSHIVRTTRQYSNSNKPNYHNNSQQQQNGTYHNRNTVNGYRNGHVPPSTPNGNYKGTTNQGNSTFVNHNRIDSRPERSPQAPAEKPPRFQKMIREQ